MKKKILIALQTNEEFDSLITKIDDELRKEDFQIFQRPLHAILRMTERFDIVFSPSYVKTEKNTTSLFNDELSTEVDLWYENRYGEKLKFDPSWKLAILIRGDVFRVRLPMVFGMPKLNLFELVDDLTYGLSKNLSKDEIQDINQIFHVAQKNRNELTSIFELPLVSEIKGDFDAAVSHLFTTPPQFGLSKWSSLQVSEKIIKSYISQKGSQFSFTHDLRNLANQAEAMGLPHIPSSLIDVIQCPAGVRYGNPSVILEEAINAHHASISISLGVGIRIAVLQRAKQGFDLIPNKYYVDTFDRVARCISIENDIARVWYIEPTQCFEYFLQKEKWAEFVGLDTPSITDPIEETYTMIVQKLANEGS
jgi:hypothetical protein